MRNEWKALKMQVSAAHEYWANRKMENSTRHTTNTHCFTNASLHSLSRANVQRLMKWNQLKVSNLIYDAQVYDCLAMSRVLWNMPEAFADIPFAETCEIHDLVRRIVN